MLDRYARKRDFDRSPEPPPRAGEGAAGPLIFVIQKHAATRLHYDFRLELDGVLKSWPIPKGPALDPKEKRLAVMVEDHPLDYASFEGVIRKGEYGAGQVIVWDHGTYSPDEDGRLSFHDRAEAQERVRQGLAAGKLSITIRGHKLKGSWALVKTKRGENEWLLIKHKDRSSDGSRDILAEDRSVISGLTIGDLKAGRLPETLAHAPVATPAGAAGARAGRLPASLAPMLASATPQPFDHPGWLFEPKLDGIRALALVAGGSAKLLGRRGSDITAQYPALAAELARQPAWELGLDGEIIALDQDGKPSFELLQQRLNLSRQPDIRSAEEQVPVIYYAFDLLHLDGYDLTGTPLGQRQALLRTALVSSERVRLLEHFLGLGEATYKAALAQGLEGVVAKRRDSRYEAGGRSQQWLKIKAVATADFVIGGYTRGSGARAGTFGALLLGSYDERGRLVYVSHVGSGFDASALADLRARLDALRAETCPFTEEPALNAPAIWARPELVAEVKFAQRTSDGSLRAPVFVRLREDKPATEATVLDVTMPSSPGSSPGLPAAQGAALDAVVEQLQATGAKGLLHVQSNRLPVTNLNKELWPAHDGHPALTKRDYLIYLTRMSPHLLRFLRDRPLTLIRYPNGAAGAHFFQKHQEHPLPEFAETVRLFSHHNEGDQEYILCNNLATLLWLGQLAGLELHTWFSRVDPRPEATDRTTEFTGSQEAIERSILNYPDFILFDLDPYIYSGKEPKGAEPELNRKGFAKTCEVAQRLRDILTDLSLSAFIKTSGRTGLHICVPLQRKLDFDAVRSVAKTVSQFLLSSCPADMTTEWASAKRTGKVFLDFNQNTRGKTFPAPYSLRATPDATVSTPLRWEELDSIYPTDFTMLTVAERVGELGDPWEGLLSAKHDLETLVQRRGAG